MERTVAEKVGVRTFWLAHLSSGTGDQQRLRLTGRQWENKIFEVMGSLARKNNLYIQGSGEHTLFGHYGASDLGCEIDAAIDDGKGTLTLVEAKCCQDYNVPRKEVWSFSAKIRDHERGQLKGRKPPYALIASAGRLAENFCRQSFSEGIDVADPQRLPVAVLVRLPHIFPGILAHLMNHDLLEMLADTLRLEDNERSSGKFSLRYPERQHLLEKEVLADLTNLQKLLTAEVLKALQVQQKGRLYFIVAKQLDDEGLGLKIWE